MPAPATAAFLGLMEPAAGHVQAYQDWHADDHLPENLALPGVVYANRWIAPPRLRRARSAPDASLADASFLVAYFFSEPLERSLDQWEALERELRAGERMFAERTLRLGGLFDLAGVEVAPGLALSARALPHRRHRGIHLHLARGREFSAEDAERWRAAIARPGVAGGMRFSSSGVREYGESRAGRAELYFIADESLDVLAGLDPAEDALFSGPFRTTADLAPGQAP